MRMLRCLAALMALAAPLAAQGPVLPDNPLAGRVLFQSKLCNHCHGLSGIRPGIAFDLGEGHFEGTFLDQGASLEDVLQRHDILVDHSMQPEHQPESSQSGDTGNDQMVPTIVIHYVKL